MRFVLQALATWRLSYMLVHEEGPNGLFRAIRERSGITHYPDSTQAATWNEWTPLHCVWCTSVWVAPFMLFMPKWFVRALALSAAAIFVHEKVTQDVQS